MGPAATRLRLPTGWSKWMPMRFSSRTVFDRSWGPSLCHQAESTWRIASLSNMATSETWRCSHRLLGARWLPISMSASLREQILAHGSILAIMDTHLPIDLRIGFADIGIGNQRAPSRLSEHLQVSEVAIF